MKRMKKNNGKTASKILTVLPMVLAAGFIPAFAETSGAAAAGEAEDGYALVWHDEFEGKKLNKKDWNYEYHEPGWVNNELQSYVDSKENVYLKDGNLVIQPVKKTDASHNVSYTSGRINLQNKHSIKYGKIEVKAKVPSGKGFLPAIWMMPDNENLYGQWPKCGEIDIMEVLGDKTNTLYSTLHYGEPHAQGQNSLTLASGSFAAEYHVFGCEWEPGEIRFYLDGKLYHTENDWYSRKPGFEDYTYPAPFDQPFYLILNVAVGGDWPGNPDNSTIFDSRAAMYVDYVRLYQKASYDENVSKPVKQITIREADSTGNLIVNGNFNSEPLDGSASWQFLTAGKGRGNATFSKNQLDINTQNCGELDYSIQLVQPGIPLEKGCRYRLSFDMYADQERKAIVSVTAPEVGWQRYFPDTSFDVGTVKKTYTFEFLMTKDTDPHARFEFNLGNQGSNATIHTSSIRLEKLAGEAVVVKDSCLPDGNYVLNGTFDTGSSRSAHWTFTGKQGSSYSVTNESNIRMFSCKSAEGSSLQDTVLEQKEITLMPSTDYVLSFESYSDVPGKIQVITAGNDFSADLGTKQKKYEFKFRTGTVSEETSIKFLLGKTGTTFIDNVCIREASLIVNGSFNAGMTGFEVYAYTNSDVSYTVDSLKEAAAFSIDISNTGDMDWKIQLKQNNVTLEKGKKYRISFDAKSSLDRTIMYALQRDGSSDNNWIPYSGTQFCQLTQDFQTFSITFTMNENTDVNTILSISMGAVKNKQIKSKHTVVIDNIVLEEVK